MYPHTVENYGSLHFTFVFVAVENAAKAGRIFIRVLLEAVQRRVRASRTLACGTELALIVDDLASYADLRHHAALERA